MTEQFPVIRDLFTKKRREKPDPTPMSIPVKFRKAESMDERITRILRHSASEHAALNGLETFDEADDFDIPDDPIDPTTPWESDFDLAAAHGIDHGVTAKPNLSPERYREVQTILKEARGKITTPEDTFIQKLAAVFKGPTEPAQ